MPHYDIFISHSSKDAGRIKWMTDDLEAGGYHCWISPRDITPGMAYARAIMQGIDSCDTLVVVITANSVKSEDVLNEIDNAHAQHKRIIPVFMEDIELPREFNYYLSRTQWVNIVGKDNCDIVALLGLSPRVVQAKQPAITDEPATPPTPPAPNAIMKLGLLLPGVALILGITGVTHSELLGLLLAFVAFAYLVVTVLALFMPRAFRLATRKKALLWYGLPFILWFLAASFIIG